MAGPITWRNINSDQGAGNRLLFGAQQALGSSADTLLRALGDYQKQNMLNDQANIQNNTQNYLDQVDRIAGGDPNRLNQPEVQAQLEALRNQIGVGNLDRAAIRTAVPDLQKRLQQAAMANIQYNEANEQEKQRGIEDSFYALVGDGNYKDAKTLLDQNNLRGEGKFRQYLSGAQDDAQNRQYRANSEGRAERGEQRAIAADARSAQSHALSMQNMRESLADRREDRALRQEDRALRMETQRYKSANDYVDNLAKAGEAQFAQAKKDNIFMEDQPDNPTKATNDLLKDLTKGRFDTWFGGSQADRTEAQRSVNSLMVQGVPVTKPDGSVVNVPIPETLIKQGLDATQDNWLIGRRSGSKDLTAYFTDMINDNPEIRDQALKAAENKDKMVQFRQQIGQARAKIKPSSIDKGFSNMSSYGVSPSETESLIRKRKDDDD